MADPVYPSVLDNSVYIAMLQADDDAEGLVEVKVSRHDCSPNTRVADGTVTGIGNGTMGAAVRNDPRWSFECPLNQSGYLEVAPGLYGGAPMYAIYFRHSSPGGTETGDKVMKTTVLNVEKINDPTSDIPRVRVTGGYGTYTPNAAIPMA